MRQILGISWDTHIDYQHRESNQEDGFFGTLKMSFAKPLPVREGKGQDAEDPAVEEGDDGQDEGPPAGQSNA